MTSYLSPKSVFCSIIFVIIVYLVLNWIFDIGLLIYILGYILLAIFIAICIDIRNGINNLRNKQKDQINRH